MLRYAALIVAALALPADALAETTKKYAEWSNNEGVAFSLQRDPKLPLVAYDVVSAWKGRARVANCDKWKAELKGVTWCFASEANLTAFKAKTDSDGDNEYLPALGGHCVLGTSWGKPGPKGDPTTAKVYNTLRGKVLVLQSAPRWVKPYDTDWRVHYKIAEAAFNVMKESGVIVPNDKLPKVAEKK